MIKFSALLDHVRSHDESREWFPLVEILLATLLFASTPVLVKSALDYTGPLTIAGFRFCFGFAFLMPVALHQHQPIFRSSRATQVRLILIGLMGLALGSGTFYWGLRYVPATTGALLVSFTPIIVLIVAALSLKEFPHRVQVAGTILALVGTIFYFGNGFRPGEIIGIALILVGLLGIVSRFILSRSIARDRLASTFSLTLVPLLVSGSTLLITAIPLEGWPVMPLRVWAVLLWLGVFNSSLAFMLFNHAARRLTALQIAAMHNLQPIMTALLAGMFVDERLLPLQWIGVIVTITGVILVQWRGTQGLGEG